MLQKMLKMLLLHYSCDINWFFYDAFSSMKSRVLATYSLENK